MNKNNPTGWMVYTASIKAELGRLLTSDECKILLSKYYMRGIPWETAIKEIRDDR